MNEKLIVPYAWARYLTGTLGELRFCSHGEDGAFPLYGASALEARAASAVLGDQGLRKAAEDANEALRNILNGNDLALERGQSIENWKDSPFRKQGNDAYHALREVLTRQDGPVIGDEPLTKVLEAALRLAENNYRPWAQSGGAEECPHGINMGIACRRCDELTVKDALSRRDPESTPPSPLPHCFACLQGQNPEAGEGTHLEGTVEHPSQQEAAEYLHSSLLYPDSSKIPVPRQDLQRNSADMPPASVQPPISDDVVERIDLDLPTDTFNAIHAYGDRYDCMAGDDVFKFVLRDARAFRERANWRSWEEIEKAIIKTVEGRWCGVDGFINNVQRYLSSPQDGKGQQRVTTKLTREQKRAAWNSGSESPVEKAAGERVAALGAEVAQLKAENELLKAPVSPAEIEEFFHADDWGVQCVYRNGIDALLTARTQGGSNGK